MQFVRGAHLQLQTAIVVAALFQLLFEAADVFPRVLQRRHLLVQFYLELNQALLAFPQELLGQFARFSFLLGGLARLAQRQHGLTQLGFELLAALAQMLYLARQFRIDLAAQLHPAFQLAARLAQLALIFQQLAV